MSAEDLLRQGQPAEALHALVAQVRAAPADARLRVFMAQLLAVLGQWPRCLQQLEVAAQLDALALPMQQVYSDAVRCEALRAAVFAGRSTPMIFGEPAPWLALLAEALLQQGRGADPAQVQDLRARAFEAAPATPGTIDGAPFAWIADADMRLGPVLEAFIHGRYSWVPFERLARLRIEPPEDLRDNVWMPAHCTFANGGEALALLPTRYPGTEAQDDGTLLLARRTEWREPQPGVFAGLGQRVWATDAGEYALMDVREIVLHHGPAAPDAPGTAAAGQGDGG